MERRSPKNSSSIATVRVHGYSFECSIKRSTWLDARIDRFEPLIAAEPLLAPALEHLGNGLFFGVQRPHRANEIGMPDIVDSHPQQPSHCVSTDEQ